MGLFERFIGKSQKTPSHEKKPSNIVTDDDKPPRGVLVFRDEVQRVLDQTSGASERSGVGPFRESRDLVPTGPELSQEINKLRENRAELTAQLKFTDPNIKPFDHLQIRKKIESIEKRLKFITDSDSLKN